MNFESLPHLQGKSFEALQGVLPRVIFQSPLHRVVEDIDEDGFVYYAAEAIGWDNLNQESWYRIDLDNPALLKELYQHIAGLKPLDLPETEKEDWKRPTK